MIYIVITRCIFVRNMDVSNENMRLLREKLQNTLFFSLVSQPLCHENLLQSFVTTNINYFNGTTDKKKINKLEKYNRKGNNDINRKNGYNNERLKEKKSV